MNKKWRKRFLALCLVLLIIPVFAACGSDQGDSQAGETGSLLEEAMAGMEDISSYRMQMTMTMDMSMDGQVLNSTTSAEGACIADPLMMEMTMNMDMGDLGAADVLMYLEQAEDGTAIVYMSMDGGTTWMKQDTVGNGMDQYNVKESMDLYLDSVESFEEMGTETVNGSEAVRYDGVISKDAMNEVMETSGIQEQLGILELSEEQIAEIYSELGEIPISVWIDKDKKLPVKYEMDMTDAMQAMMDKMIEQMGEEVGEAVLTMDRVFISMSMSDFNNVESITIPEEAKAAASV